MLTRTLPSVWFFNLISCPCTTPLLFCEVSYWVKACCISHSHHSWSSFHNWWLSFCRTSVMYANTSISANSLLDQFSTDLQSTTWWHVDGQIQSDSWPLVYSPLFARVCPGKLWKGPKQGAFREISAMNDRIYSHAMPLSWLFSNPENEGEVLIGTRHTNSAGNRGMMGRRLGIISTLPLYKNQMVSLVLFFIFSPSFAPLFIFSLCLGRCAKKLASDK